MTEDELEIACDLIADVGFAMSQLEDEFKLSRSQIFDIIDKLNISCSVNIDRCKEELKKYI